jgi:CBS-domain-containing membrane protein
MTERDPRAAPPTAGDLMRETELVIPLAMSVGAAARLLEAVGVGIAPVVDSVGRCVGVFTVAYYRRWLDRADRDTEAAPAGTDEVRHHMTRRFGLATPATGVQELLHRLGAAPDPFLVVLDGQRRPRGIVCALDVLVAESNAARVGSHIAEAQ